MVGVEESEFLLVFSIVGINHTKQQVQGFSWDLYLGSNSVGVPCKKKWRSVLYRPPSNTKREKDVDTMLNCDFYESELQIKLIDTIF